MSISERIGLILWAMKTIFLKILELVGFVVVMLALLGVLQPIDKMYDDGYDAGYDRGYTVGYGACNDWHFNNSEFLCEDLNEERSSLLNRSDSYSSPRS